MNTGRISHAEYGLLGWQGLVPLGSFEQALWTALGVADSSNLRTLSKGFPEEVEALNRYRHERGYFDNLRERAGI